MANERDKPSELRVGVATGIIGGAFVLASGLIGPRFTTWPGFLVFVTILAIGYLAALALVKRFMT